MPDGRFLACHRQGRQAGLTAGRHELQGTDAISFQGLNMISPYLVSVVSVIVVGWLILLLAGYLAIVAKRFSAVFIDLVVVLGLLATMLVPLIVGLTITVLLKR